MITLRIYVDGQLRLSETTTEEFLRGVMSVITKHVTALRKNHHVTVTREEDGICYIIPVNGKV